MTNRRQDHGLHKQGTSRHQPLQQVKVDLNSHSSAIAGSAIANPLVDRQANQSVHVRAPSTTKATIRNAQGLRLIRGGKAAIAAAPVAEKILAHSNLGKMRVDSRAGKEGRVLDELSRCASSIIADETPTDRRLQVQSHLREASRLLCGEGEDGRLLGWLLEDCAEVLRREMEVSAERASS